jgi:hypothetical protein
MQYFLVSPESPLETKSRYLLLDYRSLQINLNMNETFNIVKRSRGCSVPVQTRFCHRGRALLLLSADFNFEVFEDFDTAEKWLIEQIRKVK